MIQFRGGGLRELASDRDGGMQSVLLGTALVI